jgi:CheY-like chemotaxis protein
MIEEKLKNTVARSFKLVIIMVILIWLNYFCTQMHNAIFINNPVIFPIIASIVALFLVLIIYFQSKNISRRLKKLMESECTSTKSYLSKKKLLDNIGHELRTPMIGILGSSDLLRHSSLNAEQMIHLDTIDNCGEKLLNIIDDILDISKSDANTNYDQEGNGYKASGEEYWDDHNCGSLYNQFLPVNILLVEDNDLNQKLILQMLVNYGFEAEAVNNGLECLQILQKKDFHLILMDMQMPVLDGYDTTRKIKSNSCYDHIPIIAITANTLNFDYEKCIACGCSSYLPKPFTAAELAEEIKTYLKAENKYNGSLQSSDELISQLIPEFIEILAEMIDDLHLAVDRHDMQATKDLSHAIKGTAGMYGFMQISELAAQLEQAVREKIYSQVPRLIKQLDKFYQQIGLQQNANIVG